MSELAIDHRAVDPARIMRARHSNVTNYTQTALIRGTEYDGSRPVCPMPAATDQMLDDAEARLGFRLPSALRRLYRIRNGALTGSLWVANKPKPAPVFDDWEDAFACDYNELKPLDALQTLHDVYMENFDPEYDADERVNWFPNAEKLVILARRLSAGTALDYRFGPDPGVVLFDLQREGDARIRLRFDSFDAFIQALRAEVTEARLPLQKTAECVDATVAQRFWCYDSYAGTQSVTSHSWRAAGARLQVQMPMELQAFYVAANGGNTRFVLDVDTPDAQEELLLGPFPQHWWYNGGALLAIEQWISLRTLSDRIAFDPNLVPWAQRWPQSDRLIVLSGSFDQALMLDYRLRDQPTVVFAADLNNPEMARQYGTLATFLARLRPAHRRKYELLPSIGDSRLSAQVATPETFWQPTKEPHAASAALFKKTKQRLGVDIPEPLAALYAIQNGGSVKFCFHPPEIENAMGYRQENPNAPQWINFFPDGLLPIEHWTPLESWAVRAKVGLDVSPLLARSMQHSSDVKSRFIVISHARSAKAHEFALLDLSSSYFNQECSLLRANFSITQGRFKLLIEQKSLTHVSIGVLQRLRAKAD